MSQPIVTKPQWQRRLPARHGLSGVTTTVAINETSVSECHSETVSVSVTVKQQLTIYTTATETVSECHSL